MDNAVFETLLGVANSDGSIRTAAENRLKELAVQPGKLELMQIAYSTHPLKIKTHQSFPSVSQSSPFLSNMRFLTVKYPFINHNTNRWLTTYF